jgi:hypothetical protein
VLLQDLPKIHAVQLVARKNDDVFVVALEEVPQILAHGVRRALVPAHAVRGLLRREDFHEPA